MQAVTDERPEIPDRRGEARSRAAHAAAILDAALDAVITIDHRGHVLEFNRAAESIFGYRREDVTGKELAALVVPPDAREHHRRALERWTEAGPSAGAGKLLGKRIEVEAMRADGSLFPAELAISRVEVAGPPVFTACLREITERKAAEEARRRAEARYRQLVEQLPLAVYVDRVDARSSNLYTSPQIEDMLGYTVDEWSKDPGLFVELLHHDDRERVLTAHAVAHRTGDPMVIEYRLRASDGRFIWVHDESRIVFDVDTGNPVLQGYLLDVTTRKEAEDQLRHQAFHDPLTGLANRALFTDRVEHAVVVRESAAVVFLDLDDFKAVNDSLGHLAGDALLRAVAVRLRDALEPGDTIARLGGDEFAVLVERNGGNDAHIGVAQRLIGALERPFGLEGREVVVTASLGVGLGENAEELLRSADVAMYRAKAAGKSQYVVYAPRMDDDVVGRLELVADLRRAVSDGQLLLHYQPTVELETGRVVGLEALARWRHPRLGLLQPANFIPLAEETGQIVDIGRWVLGEACRQAAALRDELGYELDIGVNVSMRQIRRHGLADDVSSALTASGLAASFLILEITESALAHKQDDVIPILDDLTTSLGVRVALDDFGTGYSSLSLLRDLPVGALKIDRSFVDGLDAGLRQRAFVRAIVDLAEALGLGIVAEGVERAAQVAALRQVGCRFGQGFHFARPVPAEALEELLGFPSLPARALLRSRSAA